MKFCLLYIDDEERELIKYSKKFNSLNFDIIPITTKDYTKGDWDQSAVFDGILVDFDLQKSIDDFVMNMNGITLITELRQKYPNTPILIFTKQDIFQIQEDKNITRTYPSIDEIIHKSKIFDGEGELIISHLKDLIEGYRSIRKKVSKYNIFDVKEVLCAPEIDMNILENIFPPELFSQKSKFFTHRLAKYIRDAFIDYPGILYDLKHLSVFLGIEENEFDNDDLVEFFKDAEYTGVFGKTIKHWWKSKIETILFDNLDSHEINIPIYRIFKIFWKRIKDYELLQNRCNSPLKIEDKECDLSPVDKICYLTKEPVAIEHSLQYFPDSRSPIFESARVSFKKVRESDEVNWNFLTEEGREKYSKLRNNEE